MSVKDVIKSSVYESLGGGTQLSAYAIFWTLFVAALIGCYIFAIYKFSSKAAFYSRDLNVTIAGMPIVVAAIMIAMQSNLIVSLGMVGALSIVRFRNAVKNPLDLLYLFWAVSAGIICGVGLKALAGAMCIVLTVMILILQMMPNMRTTSVLMIRGDGQGINSAEIIDICKKYAKGVKEKSRICKNDGTEYIYEMLVKDEDHMIEELKQNRAIMQISLLSHDGEYRL